jgi:hypothetical protein
VQGVRKKDLVADYLSAYSDYHYNPPAVAAPPPAAQVDCPAGSPTKKAPDLSQCAPVTPTTCPAGSTTDTVPFGQQCQGPKNAVAMSITQEGLNANVAITNNSALPADCAYTAKRTSGLLGPQSVSRNLNVPANSTGNITDLLWPAPLVTYQANVKCTAQYDGKPLNIGEANQTVSG